MIRRAVLLGLIVVAVSSRPAAAASGADARVEAVAVRNGTTALSGDGHLSDAAWQNAQPIDGFVERDPDDGGAPTQRSPKVVR